jgi:hypothetical protein
MDKFILPEHIRAAMQSAAAHDLPVPSVEFEEYVATYLNHMFDAHNPLGL